MSWLRKAARRVLPRPTRPLILMYHRVAEPEFDPWALAVSEENFASQVGTLTSQRRLLSMADYSARSSQGTLPSNAVAITFDDGYADNLDAALPVLRRFDAPATFFISTGGIGQPRPYWWDELADMVLGRGKVLRTTVTAAGESWAIDLPERTPAALASIRAWRASTPPDGPHQQLYLDTWSRLQRMPSAAREQVLTGLRQVFEPPPAASADLPMNSGQIRRLAAAEGVTIGAHSVSHSRMPDLTVDAIAQELAESRQVCAELAQTAVAGFAYPYGQWSPRVQQAVQTAGFSWACTTVSGATPRKGADVLALPRLAVADMGGAALLTRLKAC